MVSTYASYKLISRDIQKSLDRVESSPQVARETAYYEANIGSVTSIEDFVGNTRLFRYAMKAYGLEDMAYAKAFMVKVLKEGIGDSGDFANKLTDKRYVAFAKTFNFDAHGEDAMNYVPARDEAASRYLLKAVTNGVDPTNPVLAAQVEYFKENIGSAKTIDDFLADDTLYGMAMKAYGLDDHISDKSLMRKILEGGVADPKSLANTQTDTAFAQFAATFDFAAHGEDATNWSQARQGTVANYVRQTLEEKAGDDNEGVRLALYFQRKASSITSVYQILGDTALASVVRTALGLPDSIASADIDRQADLLSERLDLSDFKDTEKLGKFLTRFTTMWEIKNGSTAASSPAAILLGQPPEYGISTDLLLTLQQMRR